MTTLCMWLSALVWQLMRAYTLSLLDKLKVLDQSGKSTDQQIVSWANNKVTVVVHVVVININNMVLILCNVPLTQQLYAGVCGGPN